MTSTATSRAFLLEHPGPIDATPLTLSVRPPLVPDRHEIVVAVEACGVCRTDLQLVEGDLALHRRPVVPGHQVVGRVLRAGPGASHRIGDRVGVTWLAGTCGRCEYCVAGQENLCLSAVFHGWDCDGGYADEMICHDDYAFSVASDRSATQLAPLLCAGVIGYRSLEIAQVTAGQRLGLYGFGSSASLVLQLAKLRNIEVHVATRNPVEQTRATALGADSVGDLQALPPAPLHAAITFAPVGSVVIDALRATRRAGTVVINAIHLDEIPSFDFDLLWHERSIRSVANVTRADVTGLLEVDARHPLRVEPHLYRLSDAPLALRDLAAGTIGGPGVLIP